MRTQLPLTVATDLLRARHHSKMVLPLLALARDDPGLRSGTIIQMHTTQDTSLHLKARRKLDPSRNHNHGPLVARHV
jgi:hypothetical protein